MAQSTQPLALITSTSASTWSGPAVPRSKLKSSGRFCWTEDVPGHGDLVHAEGTAHIDLSRFETTEAINFKILPVMHM